MASISTTLKLFVSQIPLNRLLFSPNTTKLSFPPSISLPFHFHFPPQNQNNHLLTTPPLPLSLPLPPSISPALFTSPTKSQTPISVAGASSARVENVRFGQKAKGKEEAGEWGKGKAGTESQ